MRTVPFSWRLAVRKTQPSSGRTNLKAWLGSEIEATPSSSVTRLLRFFAPEKTTVGSDLVHNFWTPLHHA
jgi:hypothetical protein